MIDSESPNNKTVKRDIFQSDMLNELKEKDCKVIDHRYISETLWLVSDVELRPIVEDFKTMKVIFRYVNKGYIF